MQPYFCPYLGYFQLINAVDTFVIYDNIEFTKKGWINRNRILVNSKDEYITLPLKKDSDYLHIKERFLSDSFEVERIKTLRKIKEVYRKAPHFETTYQLIQEIYFFNTNNLFAFIYNSIERLCAFLGIKTSIILSSDLDVNHQLKSEEKVLSICKALNASTYINPIGGTSLYSADRFSTNNIKILFLQSKQFSYKQFDADFVPWLSIIDVLMFNSVEGIQENLQNGFSLVTN
jgi:hypothetical protein